MKNTNKGESGTLIHVLQSELNHYASTDVLGTFFDNWDGGRDALNSIAPPITQNNLLYYNNPSAYLKGYGDTVGYGFIDTALAGITGFQYLSFLNSAVSALGIDESQVKAYLATIKTNQGEDFWLAEHHMYGSSRIGIKNYWQSQYYTNFNYDTSQIHPVVDSLTLNSRKPWYSADYQDVIDVAYLTPWGNTYNSPFTLQHILGQKGYELNNHLGNVQAVVSDKRVNASTKDNDTVDSYRPSLMAAYDYYPFGMLMPGRYVYDTSEQCAWVTTTKFVPVWVYGLEWPQWACGPTACGFNVISGGGGTVSTLNPGTSSAVLNISVAHPNAGAWNMMDVSPGLETSLLLNIDHIDEGAEFVVQVDEEADTGWVFLTNATVSGTEDLTLNFTPSQPQVKISFILTGHPTAYKTLQVKNIKHWYLTYQQETENTLVCNGAKDNYRFGYNGKEKDNEWSGIGNSLDYGKRMYDSRIARFRSVDPLAYNYPFLTTYQFASNSPIQNIDLDGLEGYQVVDHQSKTTTIVVDIFYVPRTNDNNKNGQYNSGYNDKQAERYKKSIEREFNRRSFVDKRHSSNGTNYDVKLQINLNRLDPKTSRREALRAVTNDYVARSLLEKYTIKTVAAVNGYGVISAESETGITRSPSPDDDHTNTHELWHNFTHLHPNAPPDLATQIDPNNQTPGHKAAGGIFVYADDSDGSTKEHLNQKNVDDALRTVPERFTQTTTTVGTTTTTTITPR